MRLLDVVVFFFFLESLLSFFVFFNFYLHTMYRVRRGCKSYIVLSKIHISNAAVFQIIGLRFAFILVVFCFI
ncbi:hypothetical protein HanPSC8_Chr16g0697481 [Helianthus annuus]|nr:hypothetical protein HanPSC8_Chr16g0697481 [Helianthus annuus]